jgi:hypothetical protein
MRWIGMWLCWGAAWPKHWITLGVLHWISVKLDGIVKDY